MGKKKISIRRKMERDKLSKRNVRKKDKILHCERFLKRVLKKEDIINCEKLSTNLRFIRRKRTKIKNIKDIDNWDGYIRYRKVVAAATHFFYRKKVNSFKVVPFQLLKLMNSRLAGAMRRFAKMMAFKKDVCDNENKKSFRKYRDREKNKYNCSSNVREAKQTKCRKRYKVNVDVKRREQLRNRIKYQQNKDVQRNQKERKRSKYQNNLEFRAKQSSVMRCRYQINPIIKEKEGTRMRTRYQENEEIRRRERTRMRTRYQENEDVRQKEKTKMLKRYYEDPRVLDQQKKKKRKMYQEDARIRDETKTRNNARYNDNLESKEKTKRRVSELYHLNEEVKNMKKKRESTRCKANPNIQSQKNQRQKLLYKEQAPRRERKQKQCRIKYQSNVDVRNRELVRNREVYRQDPKWQEIIKDAANQRYQGMKQNKNCTLKQHLNHYFKKIKEGPTNICICCGGLFYKEAMRNMSVEEMTNEHADIGSKVLCVEIDQLGHQFCSTCFGHIRKDKVPRFALSNGLDFAPIPAVLKDLTRLEHRLISPRIPFLQIRPLDVDKQWGVRGPLVNIENNLDICMSVLPRNFNEMSITQIKFKRRMSDDPSRYLAYEKIRPKKVLLAMKYLLDTPLFRKHEIRLNENWDHFNSDDVDFIVDSKDMEPNDNEDINDCDESIGNTQDHEETIGADETLYYTNTASPYVSKTPVEIQIAPGEGKIAIPYYRDLDAEHLSFPAIYCGIDAMPSEEAKLSYGDIAKSELRRYDRRCATAEKILFTFKKLYIKRVRDAFQVCLRQKKTGSGENRLTAKDMRDPSFLEKTIDKDDGYTVYKHVRSSPAYWMDQVKRVVAMIRQLGNCTFFITLSAAESKWNELLITLMKVVRGKDITEEEAESLDSDTKKELIRDDPVTCSRHFDHKLRALYTELLLSKTGIFGDDVVIDHFSRIEYQLRGSPHSHGIYWNLNAPKYKGDPESAKEVIYFVNQHITCAYDEEGEMKKLIQYQIHRHSPSCYKNARAVRKCRFHYPKPPLPETMILLPLSKDMSAKDRAKATSDYTTIEKKLIKMGRTFKEIIAFDEFLLSMKLTKDEYLTAVRSTIKGPTVFLRRETNAAFINNYNKQLLLAWKANLDIQFVLDAYACAKYCVGYMMKPEGGLSKLLRKAQEEGKKKCLSTKEKLHKFGSILLSGSEISAQEAVGFVLGLPNTDSSRSHVFVNTNRAGNRIGILRPREELEKLDDDSEDICVKGLLDQYCKRADELESTCLAAYACWYTYHKGNQNEDTKAKRKNTATKIWLKDKSGYVTKREKSKILRFRHFSKVSEPLDYYREKLMLFMPWRNEETELEQVQDIYGKYLRHIDAINENSKEYFFDKLFDEERLHDIIAEEEAEVTDDDIVTNQLDQLEDERCALAEMNSAPEKSTAISTLRPPQIMSYEDFSKTMRSLNLKQRRIVNEVLHRIKTGKHPFYIFLTGGAGVGKSHVITAIVQGIMHYMFYKPGSPEDIPVLVSAPTGKAAFNVNGITMHTAFKLLPNQSRGEKFRQMDYGHANTYRIKYAATKLFVIDEISMVSSIQFDQIDGRFQQMFLNPTEVIDFAGKSILAVGDFRQLPPIPKNYIFKSPDHRKDNIVSDNPKWAKFEYFELDQIMRQKGDYEFCKALNAMARGMMDDDDIALMKSREISKTCFPPTEAVYLYLWNADCADYNQRYHESLKTQHAVSIAQDTITGPGSRSQKEFDLERAKTFKRQITDGIPYEVVLQVGGLYMITTNINVADGLFNGSTGLLKYIEFAKNSAGERVPIVAWLEFSNLCIGQETRNNYRRYQRPLEVQDHCVPIERYKRNCRGAPKHIHDCELVRNQIPLIPANALTICKSQGSSLPKVVVNTKIRKLDRSNLYVACSRATSKEGLWIDGSFKPPDPPDENDPVVQEIERLKSNPVRFNQLSAACEAESKWKIYFQNIQSFLKHHNDLFSDQNVVACDVLTFVEPHVYNHKRPSIKGYDLINFIPCHGKSPGDSQGSLIFAKTGNKENTNEIINISEKKGRAHYLISILELGNAAIFVCYKHPDYSNKDFLRQLDEQIQKNRSRHIIVVGDMNMNVLDVTGNQLIALMDKYNLTTRLGTAECTTDKGTQIDVCFSNIENLLCSTYETYFTYHRGICILYDK